MSTAVICLAYLRNPKGVELLANYFERAGADLFLHVDAKVDAAPYAAVCASWPKVFMIEARTPIFWGGFNTVRAIIAALELARNKKSYKRFVLLTEDTIPLVNVEEFTRRMNSECEFIDIRSASSQSIVERYTGFFCFDALATTPRPCRTNERQFTPELLHTVNRLHRLHDRGKALLPSLHHGSTWWALSENSVAKLIKSYHEDDHLRESFEFSAIPEEQYFHTILGQINNACPLIFTDWSRKPTPYIFQSPSEIKAVETLNTTFLRKVPLGNAAIINFVSDLT